MRHAVVTPQLKHNLLSIPQLSQTHDTLFQGRFAFICKSLPRPSPHTIIATATLSNGLYRLPAIPTSKILQEKVSSSPPSRINNRALTTIQSYFRSPKPHHTKIKPPSRRKFGSATPHTPSTTSASLPSVAPSPVTVTQSFPQRNPRLPCPRHSPTRTEQLYHEYSPLA